MALSAEYFVRETASNLWRNRIMTLAAVLTVAISLSLAGAAWLLKQGVARADVRWKNGVELIVFMQPGASSNQISAVNHELKSDPLVKSYTWWDQKRSLAEFRQLFRGDPALEESVTSASQLPPSYRVVPRSPDNVSTLTRQFGSQPGVRSVNSDTKLARQIASLSRAAEYVMWALAIVLLSCSAALILNAIRVAVFARRREVAVMKLVGATNWFIRVPFMMEGLTQGLVGAAVAAGVVVVTQFGLNTMFNDIGSTLFRASSVSGHDVILTEILVVLAGALIGTVGSALGLRRFLEV
ncbi:MAG: ABC transporter permease [Acidimicrobiales bacterium]|nr:ABC transporter permease [Acidimicrobiales bacterium]MBO0886055.1 ABC transporter permease [Acidimicrobiales bacterium]MBO0893878.1 ABC transporter permease [Acidimicrobiales bacterium]